MVHAAHRLLPAHPTPHAASAARSLQLQQITVVAPVVLSMAAATLNVSATNASVEVGVKISQPPSEQPVRVSLRAVDSSGMRCAAVSPEQLTWAPGEEARQQAFSIQLTSVLPGRRLQLQLVGAEGGVVDPQLGSTWVEVMSPVVSFEAGKVRLWCRASGVLVWGCVCQVVPTFFDGWRAAKC